MVNTGKRALSNVGGRIHIDRGNERDRALLFQALDVRADDPYLRSHLHGFHAYPARLHPVTANVLVKGLSRPGDRVFDPFCGSGTVLVEALLEGRSPTGLDANPLAVMLASYKLCKTSDIDRHRLLDAARAVAESAEARRLERAGPTRRYPASLAQQFDPHVLLELDGLRAGINKIAEPMARQGLLLVLSSIANKVSRVESDTAGRASPRRLASGFTIRFFVKKTEELVQRQAQFQAHLGARKTPRAAVKHGDARRLPFENETFAAVVTSPPYPGVYDYVEHHRLRLGWLGMDTEFLSKHEIGARRHGKGQASPKSNFNIELQRCMAEMSRTLGPRGTVALVLADTAVDDVAWYADTEVEAMAPRVGLKLVAAASQQRPHFHKATQKVFGQRPRSERVLLLCRA